MNEVIKHKHYAVTCGHGQFSVFVKKVDKDTVSGDIYTLNLIDVNWLNELFPGGRITIRRCNASFKLLP